MKSQKILLLFFFLTIALSGFSQSSFIQIICEPGVSVFLNGSNKGETSDEVGGIILENLKGGTYQIKLQKRGFLVQEGSADVKEGEVYTYYASPFVPSVSIEQVGTGTTGGSTEVGVVLKTGDLKIQSIPVAIQIRIPDLAVDFPKTDDQWIANNVVVGKYAVEYIWNTKQLKDTIEIREGELTHMFVKMMSNEIVNRSSWGKNETRKVIASVVSNPVVAQQEKKQQEEIKAAELSVVAEQPIVVANESNSRSSRRKNSNEEKEADKGYNFTGSGQSPDEIEMVFVDGGAFEMGSDVDDEIERPKHTVRLSSFYMSKFEITNRQYCQFLNSIKCLSSGIFEGKLFFQTRIRDVGIEYVNGSFVVKPGKDYFPVVAVTWYGADAFCRWAGGRLPTEAEWEYAAKGGLKSQNYVYSGSRNINKVGWYKNNSDQSVHMVGQKDPNELGLYDMTGNVTEWVNDWYNPAYYSVSDVTNPRGPETGEDKVTRGGCFVFQEDACRITKRIPADPVQFGPNAGFRLYKASQ